MTVAEHTPPTKRAVFRRVADVTPERVRWLWEGRIPRGKLSLFDGDPGLGKSTMLAKVAACVTTGDALPGGEPTDPAAVVLLSAEDGVADTIRPRLAAAGANLSLVYVFDGVRDDKGVMRPASIPEDLEHIEAFVREKRAALVVVDPFMAFLGGGVDAHRDQDVRRALHEIADVAQRTDAAFSVVRHLNKSGGRHAMYRGGGSIGIIGAARTALLVGVDPEDDQRRILAVTKCNVGPIAPSLAYRLVSAETHGCAYVEWDGTTNHTADSLVALPEGNEDTTERDDAAAWLLGFLANGPVKAPEVFAKGRANGHTDRTLKRVKRAYGIRSVKQGMEGGWAWVLPTAEEGHADAEEAEEGHTAGRGTLRASSGDGSPLRGREPVADELPLHYDAAEGVA